MCERERRENAVLIVIRTEKEINAINVPKIINGLFISFNPFLIIDLTLLKVVTYRSNWLGYKINIMW